MINVKVTFAKKKKFSNNLKFLAGTSRTHIGTGNCGSSFCRASNTYGSRSRYCWSSWSFGLSLYSDCISCIHSALRSNTIAFATVAYLDLSGLSNVGQGNGNIIIGSLSPVGILLQRVKYSQGKVQNCSGIHCDTKQFPK